MRLDVVDLARFYASPLGEAAQAMVLRRLQALWPDVSGLDVLGLGYATPFLAAYARQARRVVAAMPGAQGVERWPVAGGGRAALVEETRLPFREALFDRVIIAHMLEETESLRAVMREVWRATAPEARIVVVAANRRGLWSRTETSPFGHGRSFTRAQLGATVRACLFEPTAWARALYAPPIPWPAVARAAEAWEKTGEVLWPRLSGVLLLEAVKRVGAAAPGDGARARERVFAPAAAPAPGGAAWRRRRALTAREAGASARRPAC